MLTRAERLSFHFWLFGLSMFMKFGYDSYVIPMDSLLYALTIKSEAVYSSKTSAATYQTVRGYKVTI
jgi:hypothetical protein